MTPETVITIAQDSVRVLLLISMPLMMTALVVGLAVSLFQAVTQIQEMTLTFIPKVVAMFVLLIILFPWMLSTMLDYTRELFGSIPGMVG